MNQLNVNLPELPYAVSEAMNRLRINIKFCGKNTRKILLTSCQPNEGKSTISSYLWKMLAEAGKVVDDKLMKAILRLNTKVGEYHTIDMLSDTEQLIKKCRNKREKALVKDFISLWER